MLFLELPLACGVSISGHCDTVDFVSLAIRYEPGKDDVLVDRGTLAHLDHVGRTP